MYTFESIAEETWKSIGSVKQFFSRYKVDINSQIDVEKYINERGQWVYEIKNIKTGKKYIGSTQNFYTRRQSHYICLKKNKHTCVEFQEEYNLYNKKDFVFNILVRCDCKDKRDKLELEFIKKEALWDVYNTIWTWRGVTINTHKEKAFLIECLSNVDRVKKFLLELKK